MAVEAMPPRPSRAIPPKPASVRPPGPRPPACPPPASLRCPPPRAVVRGGPLAPGVVAGGVASSAPTAHRGGWFNKTQALARAVLIGDGDLAVELAEDPVERINKTKRAKQTQTKHKATC